MKRLLAQIGITTFSVSAAAFYLPRYAVILIAAAAAVTAVVFFSVRKIRKTIFLPAMAVAALLACLMNIGYTLYFVEPVEERYGGGEHTVRAVLTEEEYRSYSKYYYRLKTTEIDGEKVSRKLLLKTCFPLDAEPDDAVAFTSQIDITDNQYYRAKGYFLVSDSIEAQIDVTPAVGHTLYYRTVQIRRFMRKTLESVLPSDCDALCRAVLIGDKYALDYDVRDSFRCAGASYFIVVSGMHFAVISFFLMWLLKRLSRMKRMNWMNRWVRMAFMLAFILTYAAITGFQSSVLRSGIMIALTVLSVTLRRIPYAPNHLGIAGILLPFILTPYGAGDIGLILSFYATLAILLWAGPIARKICIKDKDGNIPQFRPAGRLSRWYKRIKAKIRKEKPEPVQPFDFKLILIKVWNAVGLMLSASLAANILVFPISVFVFREFSLVTLLSAVLLYAEIYLILILSFLICVLFWCKPVIVLLAYPLMWLCRLVLWIVDGLSSLPFATIRVSEWYFFIWVAVTAVLGCAVLLYRNHYRFLLPAALCSAVILLAGGLTYTVVQAQFTTLEAYSCGSGVCVGLNCGGRLHLLRMDAKSKELYQTWKKLSERFSGADTALCFDQGDLKKLRMYRQDEFAISGILLYDKVDDSSEEDNILPFSGGTAFILDDDVMLQVNVLKDKPVPYLTACGKTILIVPDNCLIDDIPESERIADIIVLSQAKDGMEALRCQDLIICDDRAFALRTAKALSGCYQNVYLTDTDDVRYRLR